MARNKVSVLPRQQKTIEPQLRYIITQFELPVETTESLGIGIWDLNLLGIFLKNTNLIIDV